MQRVISEKEVILLSEGRLYVKNGLVDCYCSSATSTATYSIKHHRPLHWFKLSFSTLTIAKWS